MKNPILLFLCFGLLASIAFYGCTANLQPEIKAAQRALDKAKDYHSEELAPADWKESLQVWEEAQAALKKGDHPSVYLKKAKAQFEKTIAVAEANGLVMKKEIDDIQKTINGSYMKIRVATREKGRIKPKILKELNPMLDEVAIGSSSVKDLIMHFDYPEAMTKVLDTQKKMRDAEMLMAAK